MSSSVSRRSFAVLAVGASLSATAVNAAPITLLSEDWETHQGNPPATWTFNNAANTSFSTTAHQSSTMLTMTDASSTATGMLTHSIGSYTGSVVTLALDAYMPASSANTSYPARCGVIALRNGNNIVAGLSFRTKGSATFYFRDGTTNTSYAIDTSNAWLGGDVKNAITLTYNQTTGAVSLLNTTTNFSYTVTPAVASSLAVNGLYIGTSTTASDTSNEALFLDNISVVVPEPTAVGLMTLVPMGLLGRRRRRE